MIYVTRGLAEALLELASNAEPEEISVGLAMTAAGDLDGAEALDPSTPVFTDFYLPDAGRSVSAVFGVDLGTPPGQTHGRFVSHPTGELQVERTDELHAALLVAVPPWTLDDVRAFSRDGTGQELAIVDAEPPREFVV